MTTLSPHFPHNNLITVDEETQVPAPELISMITPYLTQNRIKRIEDVVNMRTYTITTVTEHIFDQGNINAIIRSSEAFGFSSIHVIDSKEFRLANRVTQGAHKWMDIFHHESNGEAISKLRNQGYKIAATALRDDTVSFEDIDYTQKTAIIFGNEHQGVSPEMQEEADMLIKIPQVGFSQSFNISVAASIFFQHMFYIRNKLGHHGDLSEEEKTILRAHYYLKSIKTPHMILEQLTR